MGFYKHAMLIAGNLDVSRQGLYDIGRREGFLVKDEGGRCRLDVDKFNRWLSDVSRPAPEGWLCAKDIAAMYGVSMKRAYSALNECETVAVGRGRVTYGEPESIRKALERK